MGKALMRMTTAGDMTVIKACTARFTAENEATRCQAVDAVAHIAQHGCEKTFRILLPLLQHDHHMQRHAADGLKQIAGNKSQRTRAIKSIEASMTGCSNSPTLKRACEVAMEELKNAQQKDDQMMQESTPTKKHPRRRLAFCMCGTGMRRQSS